jgi:hypothetical protein
MLSELEPTEQSHIFSPVSFPPTVIRSDGHGSGCDSLLWGIAMGDTDMQEGKTRASYPAKRIG